MHTQKITLSTSVRFSTALWLLIALDAAHLYFLQQLPLSKIISPALFNGMIYTSVLWFFAKQALSRLTLCYLALPYVFFIFGWLNAPAALCMFIIFYFCFKKIWSGSTPCSHHNITVDIFLTFLILMMWVNISGAGSYGYQSHDWFIHNARLHDLTELSWPIHYGADQNLIYYIGYFIPSAIVGKLTSLEIATKSLFTWTLIGVFLATRWLHNFSGWRYSFFLAIIFVFFGSLDIINIALLSAYNGAFSFADVFNTLASSPRLDFKTGDALGFFLGGFLSNSFQLFWSPHQVIAGWLSISLMTFYSFKNKNSLAVSAYALLCLWSPLIMMALSPFMVFLCLQEIKNKTFVSFFKQIISPVLLALFFVIFYFSGSATVIPHPTLFTLINHSPSIITLLIFYLASWGIYGLIICAMMAIFCRDSFTTKEKQWFGCLLISATLLPIQLLGEQNDLLCRGSAPLMFLFLVFLLKGLQISASQKHHGLIFALAVCLILSSGSALNQMYTHITKYGKTRPTGDIVSFIQGYENLGPDDSIFGRYFRKNLSITHSK